MVVARRKEDANKGVIPDMKGTVHQNKKTAEGTRIFWSILGMTVLGVFGQLGFFLGTAVSEELNTIAAKDLWEKPKPPGWEEFSHYRLRDLFECSSYESDQTKALPTMEEYQHMRDSYRKHVNEHAIFEDSVPPTLGYNHDNTGGPPPYYAGHTKDGKGRGLFASRDIKKGELVHDGTNNDNKFPDRKTYNHFVYDLPQKNACDMLYWCWRQRLEKNGRRENLCTFNISSLMNGSTHDYNIDPESTMSQKFYAVRDIKKNDEIMYNYLVYSK